MSAEYGGPLRMLISYHYFRTSDLDRYFEQFPEHPEVFADSGAFSALSVGADIDVDEYGDWLAKWAHHFSIVANLDVIGDHEASAANQAILESKDLAPLPVFHVGEPFAALEALCEQYQYVALGGMVIRGKSAPVHRWAIQCFQVARKYGTVFHGFGQTTMRSLMDLPWYSVDSSSWSKVSRYGSISLWDDSTRKMITLKRRDFDQVYKLATLVRAHGYDPKILADDSTYSRPLTVGLAAVAYRRLENYLRQRHGLIGPPEGHALDGLRLFVAGASAATDYRDGAEGLRLYLATTSTPLHLDASYAIAGRMEERKDANQMPDRADARQAKETE